MPDLTRPAYMHVPPRSSTAGGDAVELAAECGIVCDPEQALILDAFLSERADGAWAATEACIVEPRQNGKSDGVLLPAVLAHAFLYDAQQIVWTAHLYKTAQKAFRSLKTAIAASHLLQGRVRQVREANGEEGVTLVGGARIDFLARSKTGGRGLTGDVIVLDEAFALDDSHMGTLLPTLSARPNPQVLYASSAGLSHSHVLRGIRDQGRRGDGDRLAYVEYCAPGSFQDPGCDTPRCSHTYGVAGCALDRSANWRAANHTLDRRMGWDTVRTERRRLVPLEFARERLGWWDEPAGVTVITDEQWLAAVDASSTFTGPPVLAWDVSPELRSAAIVAAGWRDDGAAHVEVVAHRAGTAWLAGELARLQDEHDPVRVVCPDMPHVQSVVPDVEAAGVSSLVMSRAEFAAACGALAGGVRDGSVKHLGDPILGAALAGAGKVDVGDGAWVWARKRSEVDISPLVAATAACRALQTAPTQGPLVAWR